MGFWYSFFKAFYKGKILNIVHLCSFNTKMIYFIYLEVRKIYKYRKREHCNLLVHTSCQHQQKLGQGSSKSWDPIWISHVIAQSHSPRIVKVDFSTELQLRIETEAESKYSTWDTGIVSSSLTTAQATRPYVSSFITENHEWTS